MQTFWKTPFAALEPGVSCPFLTYRIWYVKLIPPQKGTSGDYFWTEDDISRARMALEFRFHRQED